MSLEQAFQLALSLAAGLGGLWIRQLQQELTELKRQSEQIRRDYQRRDDAAKTDDQHAGRLERFLTFEIKPAQHNLAVVAHHLRVAQLHRHVSLRTGG